MRRIIFSTCAALGLLASASGAQGADMPVKAPVFRAPVAIGYDWTGFYLGGNLGYSVGRDASSSDNTRNNIGLGIIEVLNKESWKLAPAGWLGGVQTGYNWQTGNVVFGIEADLQATGQKDTACLYVCRSDVFGAIETIEQKLPWLGTVRGRLGLANGAALFYLTGGFAYGKVESTIVTRLGIDPVFSHTFSETKSGGTVGGGIEAAIAGHWTVKAEYLYVDLGSVSGTFTNATGVDRVAFGNSVRDHIVRLGMNYRFGQPSPAVAAAMPVKIPVAAPAPRWTGPYAGASAGYGVARDPTSLLTFFGGGFLDNNESWKLVPAGWLAGAQIGHNWQMAHWVFGVEADFQGTGQKDTACVVLCRGQDRAEIEQKLPWFGTVRGRLGWAASSALLYVTGGWAYGRIETNITHVIGEPDGTTSPKLSSTKSGWTLGGGIEAPVAPNWTVKAEYLYIDLGSVSQTYALPSDPGLARTTTFSSSIRNHVARVGLNYQFWGGPVVAKY